MTKLIAFLLMIIDHTAYIFESQITSEMYWIGRGIGRLSFPIFVYLLAKGINKTSDRFNYFARTFTFAIISEVIIQYTGLGSQSHLNIMFSLSLYIIVYTLIESFIKNTELIPKIISAMFILLFVELSSIVEYGREGLAVFIIMSLAFNLNDKGKITNLQSKIFSLIGICSIFSISVFITGQYLELQLISSLSAVFMFNRALDRRLTNHSVEKWFFYIAYPLQWVIFSIIN